MNNTKAKSDNTTKNNQIQKNNTKTDGQSKKNATQNDSIVKPENKEAELEIICLGIQTYED